MIISLPHPSALDAIVSGSCIHRSDPFRFSAVSQGYAWLSLAFGYIFMHPILHLPIVTLTLLFVCQALFAAPPSEFLLTNPDGIIKSKGIYTRSDDGNVSRYDVYDAHEKLLYSEIPYYAPDGRIIRADRLDPTGTPMAVIVYLEDKAVELDTSGKVVSTNAFTQDPYLQSKKAEQVAAANP